MKATNKISHKKVHKSKPNPSFSTGNETKNSCKDGHVFLGAARARFRSTSKCRIKSTGRLQQALCSGLEPGVSKLPGVGTLKTHERLRRWLHSSPKNEVHAGRVSQPLPPIPTAARTGLGIDLNRNKFQY